MQKKSETSAALKSAAAYLVRFTADEAALVRSRADAEEMTVAALLRAGVGFPPMEHGGKREGAGRAAAKKVARKRRAK